MIRHAQITLAAALALLPFAAGGCLEVASTTRLHDDGALDRTIEITGDSAEIASGKHALPLDRAWTRSMNRTPDGKTRLLAFRSFSSAADMNRALRGTAGRTITVHADVRTRFEWFFTRYTYRETWRSMDPYSDPETLDPARRAALATTFRRFLVDSTLRARNEDSLFLAHTGIANVDSLMKRYRFEVYFRIFLDGVRAAHDPGLPPDTVLARREALFRLAPDIDVKRWDTVRAAFIRVLGTAAARAYALEDTAFARMQSVLTLVETATSNSYRSSVIMPGIITDTDSRSVVGNTAAWKDYINICAFSDFTMYAESRRLNWWAVILTGGGILGGGIALGWASLARVKRRRPRPDDASGITAAGGAGA